VRVAESLLDVARLLTAKSRFKEGNLVQFKGKRRVYKVVRVDQFGNYDLEATTGGPRGSRPTNVVEADLQPAGKKETLMDNKGRTAQEAAMAEFPKGADVVLDMYRITREQLGTVKSISKAGVIDVQLYSGGKWDESQESYVPDKKSKGVLARFKPNLYGGEFTWGSKSESLYIKKRYTGGKLSSLLD